MPKAQLEHTKETVEKDPVRSESPILYDRTLPQAIPINIEQNDRKYRVVHNLDPLLDERYFDLESSFETTIKRSKGISTSIYAPKETLWSDLCTDIEGYKPRPDWKERMDQAEAVAAVNALLHVQVLANEGDGQSELYDPDELITIRLNVMQSGVLITTSLSFRPDTKNERDEFLNIEANQPNPNALASLDSSPKQEKLCILGRKLLKGKEGYASDVPAWHLAPAVETFFARQIGKMGKSLTP